MRDDFSEKTKTILAKRVGYRCSFPGCGRVTVGPGHRNPEHVISLGEAAHIYSASPNGPRNNPNLTRKERMSVQNGIWMCKSHARMIDADEDIYSADTLIKWRQFSEQFAFEKLETLNKEDEALSGTLIMLDVNMVFKAMWICAGDDRWEFKILAFIEGDITSFKAFVNSFPTFPVHKKYVIIESQGDGRQVEKISWRLNNNFYEISCKILPKSIRSNPHDIGGDFAMDDDGDLKIENGDLGIVHGVEYALQSIRSVLGMEFGWWASPLLGSNFTAFYKKYRSDSQLLNSIVKLEMVRLLTVPISDYLSTQSMPVLNFINRVNNVEVLNYDSTKPYLPIKLSLEWGNCEYWQGELKVPIVSDRIN